MELTNPYYKQVVIRAELERQPITIVVSAASAELMTMPEIRKFGLLLVYRTQSYPDGAIFHDWKVKTKLGSRKISLPIDAISFHEARRNHHFDTSG